MAEKFDWWCIIGQISLMESPSPDKRVIRFGTFEADPATGELRKGERRINLQEQPFRLLLLLLEHPGEVVTRDELRGKLWGETFVDFEEGLNTAVRKLRDALGDSASNPRFVETLPRRGYRFIAPVERTGAELPQPEPIAVKIVQPRSNSRMFWLAGCGVLLVAAAFLARLWLNREQPTAAPTPPKQLTRDSGLTTDPAISRDGKLLAYASDRGAQGNLDIWVQQVASGPARKLTEGPADNYEPEISPDGSEVLFRSDRDGGGIYSVSPLGGEARLVIKDAYLPRFSPDGTQIAYLRGHFGSGAFSGNLYVYARATGSERMLAPNVVTVGGAAAWSPDGRSLIFAAADGIVMPFYLWMCPTDGKQATRLSATPLAGDDPFLGQVRSVSVARFRNQLIVSAKHGDSYNLWTVPIKPEKSLLAGELKQITLGSGSEELPAVSDDGRVVFANHSSFSSIWEAALEKTGAFTNPRRLTQDKALNYRPSLSADGSKMAYTSNRSGKFEIWVRDMISGQESAITTIVKPVTYALISRDGNKIAFWEDGVRTYVVSTSGGGPRFLCEKCNRPDDWTSDGKIIVPFPPRRLDPSNGVLTDLAQHPTLSTTGPRLSPDEKWFTFHTSGNIGQQIGRQRQIFLAPYSGHPVPLSRWLPVTDGQGLDREAAFSPDGNRIYFLSDRDGFRCIWARTLHANTKRPIGTIYPVLHLHNPRISLLHVPNTGLVRITPVGNKIIFAMGELTGNLWMTELPR